MTEKLTIEDVIYVLETYGYTDVSYNMRAIEAIKNLFTINWFDFPTETDKQMAVIDSRDNIKPIRFIANPRSNLLSGHPFSGVLPRHDYELLSPFARRMGYHLQKVGDDK